MCSLLSIQPFLKLEINSILNIEYSTYLTIQGKVDHLIEA